MNALVSLAVSSPKSFLLNAFAALPRAESVPGDAANAEDERGYLMVAEPREGFGGAATNEVRGVILAAWYSKSVSDLEERAQNQIPGGRRRGAWRL